MSPSALVSLACLVLCLIFFIYCRSYLKRRTGQERILAEFRDEVNGILAEIDDKTDRDARLVEERIRRLHAVLEDTDKRIALYVRELDRRDNQVRTYAELGKRRIRINEGAPPPGEAEPPPGPRIVHAAQEIPPRPRPVADQMAELSRAGLSPGIIASRLGLSVAEVEFALAIAERKSPPPRN